MQATYQRIISGSYEAGDYGNHLLPFLWQKGEDREVIRDYLERIAASDIHEVCLESRPHPDFCGDGWWADLGFIVGECRRLGLKVWLLDDAHFPTGYANGIIAERHPELRHTVLRHLTLDVVGPTPRMSLALGNPFDPTERFFGAVAVRDGQALDVAFEYVAGEDGRPARLVFDAPAGQCKVWVLLLSQQTGFRDEYISMVDKASCDALIEAVYEPTYEHLGSEFGRTILGFFSDEPGFMNEKGVSSDSLIGKESMALPWSDELERRLRAELGERFWAELPGLWDREPSGAHVRHVFMDLATQLYRECFTENLGSWCRAHGVRYIGHVIEDKDSHARLGVGAGHYFRAVAGQDMAGVDVVINQLVPGIESGTHSYGRGYWDMTFFNYALAKLGSSAAHLDPLKQGRCMAEVFGAFGWHEGLKEMRWIADHFLVRGVNWFVPHAFSQAPFPDPDCSPHFYAHGENPQFRAFPKLMTYMNRMGTLLSGGHANPSAAVLYHADAEWCGEAMPVERVARELTRRQLDFDFVPEEAFACPGRYEVALVPAGDGVPAGLVVNGQRYGALVVPHAEFLGSATVALAGRAAAAGVPVLFVGGLPRGTWDGEGADVAGFVPLPEGALAGATVVSLDEVAAALEERGLRDVRVADEQPWLRAYHYTREGEEYYLFVNEHPKLALRTRVLGLAGARFDVLNGGGAVAFDEALELAPYESCLVVAGAQAPAAAVPVGERVAVGGPWAVACATPTGYPAFGEARELASLEDLSTTLWPGVCGTFSYEATFELAQDVDAAVLDLGDAYETVEAWVDGRPLGCRIAPPYRLAAGALGAGGHTLRVEVTNTLDKSVYDMFAMTEPSEPSGLLGPVELRW